MRPSRILNKRTTIGWVTLEGWLCVFGVFVITAIIFDGLLTSVVFSVAAYLLLVAFEHGKYSGFVYELILYPFRRRKGHYARRRFK